jgi:hypothetical protein
MRRMRTTTGGFSSKRLGRLRELLGTGVVPAEPGTVPIADALDDQRLPRSQDFWTAVYQAIDD